MIYMLNSQSANDGLWNDGVSTVPSGKKLRGALGTIATWDVSNTARIFTSQNVC